MRDTPDPSRLTRLDTYDDGVNAWSMARFAPAGGLAACVDAYTDYSERTGGFTTRRELPHAEAVFIVNLGEPIFITGGDGREITLRGGEAFIAGAHLRPALSRSGGSQRGVHVFLSLPSLRRMLGVPLDLLADQVRPLDAVLGDKARALGASLHEAASRGARIASLEAELTRFFAAAAPLPAPQAHALALLRHRPDLDIADVALEVGWSRKHLAARVRDAIGVGPRSYRRLLRFQQLTAALRVGRPASWAATASEAGYCDQSHMIREFREFAGLTPGEFLTRSLPVAGGLVEA